MADIVSVHWDFGNGQTSNKQNPVVQFEPGVYNVTLDLTDSDGNEFRIEKVKYVAVSELNSSLSSGDYIDNPVCLHFGWKDEHGFGWSYNDGNFPWPLTPASVIEYEENGVKHTLVYDITDGIEYDINSYDSHTEKASYKDKGIYSIETEVITPEFTGEMKSYDVSHVETNLLYKPDILTGEFDPNFSVNVSLITDEGENPVETRHKVDTRKEVMFYYQNRQSEHTRQRQLKLTTTESNYQLLTYESFFKSNDRLKRATINQSMADFANPSEWYTRGYGYNFDRVSGEYKTNTLVGGLTGPDGISGTGETVAGFELTNTSTVNSVVVWGKNAPPAFSNFISLVPYGDAIDGWQLYYYNGVIEPGVTLSGDIYDLRVFRDAVSEDSIFEYRDKFKSYLPRA